MISNRYSYCICHMWATSVNFWTQLLTIIACDVSWAKTSLTFLDLLDGSQRGPVGAHRQAHTGCREFRWGQHCGRPIGGVREEGAAKALSSAFPPITVDGCLELIRIAQASLITFIRVQVLHVSERRKKLLTQRHRNIKGKWVISFWWNYPISF